MRSVTPAKSVAALALAFLLAGTGGAVAGAKVTSAKIKDNTIQSRDIRNGTIKAKDLTKSARKAFRDGVRGYEVVFEQMSFPADQLTTHTASCPAGKRLIGGFAPITSDPYAPDWFRYYLFHSGEGIAVEVRDTYATTVEAQLICAYVS